MRIRSLKHKQLIALLLIALTPLFALTASMWMQAVSYTHLTLPTIA